MESFEAIAKHCNKHSRLEKSVIDDFLIYYAARQDRLERKMDQKLKRYRHVAKQIPVQYVNILKSEYIAAQVFRKNGLLGKYLRHSTIKALPPESYDLLTFHHQHPWRFSFATIVDRPADDFFQMQDVFTGEEYLLYSPGIAVTLTERPVLLWFNLIGFNGKCWQTFGLIIGFNGFTAEDLFFFGTELDPDIENEEELMQTVEQDPWPFFMLLSRAMTPLTQSRGELLAYHTALDDCASFPYERLKETFDIQWKDQVYELKLGEWSDHPHFAKAYYDESEAALLRVALTKTGFSRLTRALRQQGLDLDPEPEVEVTPGMLLAAEEILSRKIELNPYEERFVERNAAKEEEMDKLNYLLSLAMPMLNNDEPLDIEKLAAEADVDVETAKSLVEAMQKQLRKMRDGE